MKTKVGDRIRKAGVFHHQKIADDWIRQIDTSRNDKKKRATVRRDLAALFKKQWQIMVKLSDRIEELHDDVLVLFPSEGGVQ